MFDFQKLTVYQKSKEFNWQVRQLIKNSELDRSSRDQLFRAAMSITLNIAEGSGRFSFADRKNFYIIARGSVFECVAILDLLKDSNAISSDDYDRLFSKSEELSRMLWSMIDRLKNTKAKSDKGE
jgi:four helix bundle protein